MTGIFSEIKNQIKQFREEEKEHRKVYTVKERKEVIECNVISQEKEVINTIKKNYYEDQQIRRDG